MRNFNPEFLNRPRKRDNPESRLVVQCLVYLRTRGLFAGKIKTLGSPLPGGGFRFDPNQITGLPDILAHNPKTRVLYGLECKVGKNIQTPNQIAFQKIFHFPPFRIYAVIKSLEDLEKIIS